MKTTSIEWLIIEALGVSLLFLPLVVLADTHTTLHNPTIAERGHRGHH